MTMFKRILFTILGVSFIAGLFSIAPVVAPVTAPVVAPQTAAACTKVTERTYCLAHYKNVDAQGDIVKVCKDWSNGTCGSTRGYLFTSYGNRLTWNNCNQGTCEPSKGWNDSDGLYVPSGWDVATNKIGIIDGWARYKKTGWYKQSGCFGCYRAIKRYPN